MAKGLLTAKEAARNYYELRTTLDPLHSDELADKIQIRLLEEAINEKEKEDV